MVGHMDRSLAMRKVTLCAARDAGRHARRLMFLPIRSACCSVRLLPSATRRMSGSVAGPGGEHDELRPVLRVGCPRMPGREWRAGAAGSS
jgi:hypothetical protein